MAVPDQPHVAAAPWPALAASPGDPAGLRWAILLTSSCSQALGWKATPRDEAHALLVELQTCCPQGEGLVFQQNSPWLGLQSLGCFILGIMLFRHHPPHLIF